MTRLFISIYLDENVDVRVADMIRGRRFEAVTCREAGLLGRNDEDQLAYAAEHRLALVTHNRVHFEDLARRWIQTGAHHSGIIIAAGRPYYDTARRLLTLLNQVTADEMDDQVLYV